MKTIRKLLALAGGLLIAACATGKDYAAVYVNDAAVLNADIPYYPPYLYLNRFNAAPAAVDPKTVSLIDEARQYTNYLHTIAKAKEAAKASPHVIAVDDRYSLPAYAEGVTVKLPAYLDTNFIPRLTVCEPYTRSVLIGKCTNIMSNGTGNRYTITIRVDHAGSPALLDVFERYEEFKIDSNIWVEGPRIPFEVGAVYMIYAEKLEVMEFDDPAREEIGVNVFSELPIYRIGAWVHGIDDFDRREIYERSGGELPRELQDTSLPTRLLSTSPYQKAGGIDFDIGTITGADMSFEVLGREILQYNPSAKPHHAGAVFQLWSHEALQYAPFIKLDASGAAGALNSKSGFLWKKWIALSQIAQNTVRVIATSRREAIPYFMDDPRVFDGRSFLETEYRNGAQVCMISGALAYQNGLEVGDSIPLAFFNSGYTHGYDASGMPDATSLLPIPYAMSDSMDNPVPYKIIGIFRSPEIDPGPWFRNSPFSIDANTVIVPSASLKKNYPAPQAAPITDPETGEALIPVTRFYLPERFGMFSVMLKPGAVQAFLTEMEERGFGGLWNYRAGYSVYGNSGSLTR
jgi:hypothetical protein